MSSKPPGSSDGIIMTLASLRLAQTLATLCLAATVGLSACSSKSSGGGGSGSTFTQSGPSVQAVVTSGDQSQLLAAQSGVGFGTGGSESPTAITINPGTQYQTIDGFGASLTDSSAWVIWNDLSASQRTALMQDLFSPTQGIGLSFLRQPMGASDFAVNGNYSYDDMPPGQTDPQLSNFSIAHDQGYIIPLLQQALTLNSRARIVALPWSPPAWMKTTGTMNGGNFNASYSSSFAQYFVLFLKAYGQAGIPIYAVSVQNEPLYSTTSYPSVSLPETDEASFIANNLGPALQAAGLGSPKIFGYEHNWDNTNYPEALLAGPAANYVAGSSFHCYAGDPSAQSTVHTAYPGKDLWFTECSGTVGSNFAGDLVWNSQNLLIGATRNWARSVSLWNLALDQNSGPKNGGCSNCRGVVTVDASTSPATITHNVEYYVLAHLSKFVVPGAVRIDSNPSTGGGIEDVAFQNPDGSIVLFVLNAGSGSQPFAVNWNAMYFNYTLPAQSVATFMWK
ncbi:MAG TPA: glycoside hydrolase family 30 beta sandwich domain-containing protein [Candidatus Sulfotelmatobacter sp.]|nr:glycoside hydrolase family 30 beta sandwich domain-containing protein [Candidatus Sulfotelmatobacter sp.]